MAVKRVIEFRAIITFFQSQKKGEHFTVRLFEYYLLNFIFVPTFIFWDFAKTPHI